MQKDAEVAILDLQAPAGFSSVDVLEEDDPQHFLISRRKARQDCSNPAPAVFGHQRRLRVACLIELLGDVITHRPVPCAITVRLEQDIVADGVDERAETFGVFEPTSAPQGREHAKERFLVRVLNPFLGPQSRAQLEPE